MPKPVWSKLGNESIHSKSSSIDTNTSTSTVSTADSSVPEPLLSWEDFLVTPASVEAPFEPGTFVWLLPTSIKSGCRGSVYWSANHFATEINLPAAALNHPAIILKRASVDFQSEDKSLYHVAMVTSADSMTRQNWLIEREVRHDIKGSLPLAHPKTKPREFFSPEVYGETSDGKIPVLRLLKDHPQPGSKKLSYTRTEGYASVPRFLIRQFNHKDSFGLQPKANFESFKVLCTKLGLKEDPHELYYNSTARIAAAMQPSKPWPAVVEAAAKALEEKNRIVPEIEQYLDDLMVIKAKAERVILSRIGLGLKEPAPWLPRVSKIQEFGIGDDFPSHLIQRVLKHAVQKFGFQSFALGETTGIVFVAVNHRDQQFSSNFDAFDHPILGSCKKVVEKLVKSGKPLDNVYVFEIASLTILFMNDLALCLCFVERR